MKKYYTLTLIVSYFSFTSIFAQLTIGPANFVSNQLDFTPGNYWSAWMQDPLEATGSGKVWVMPSYYNYYGPSTLLEYASINDLQSKLVSKSYVLPFTQAGTGSIVYDGYFYFVKADSRTLIKYDLRTQTVKSTLDLPNAGIMNTYPWNWGGYSDISFAIDETGLYVIYATPQNNGNIVISKLNITDFTIIQSWNTLIPKNWFAAGVTSAFMINGILYAVGGSFATSNNSIIYQYNTSTSSGSTISIPINFNFTSPNGTYVTQVLYNPLTKLLYVWNAGSLFTYLTNGPGLNSSILTSALSFSTYCQESNISVSFTVSGTFNAGNTFTAQLGDASGNFTNPVNIGSISATTSGTINATVPSNTLAGTGYRIRVVSSDPAVVGNDNGTNITINALPTVTITPDGPTTFCPNGSVNLSSTAGSSYSWSTGATTQTIPVNTSGDYTVTMTDANGCSATSPPQTITVQDNEVPIPNIQTLPAITAECSTTVTPPTATDNCAGTITATTSDPLFYDKQGDYTIHWKYDDGNGHVVTQNQTISIHNHSVPVVSNCPDNITVYTGAGNTTCSVPVNWSEPTANDVCDGTLSYISRTHEPGSIFNVGKETVAYTFENSAGTQATCSFDVTVVDNTPPVPNVQVLPDVTAECSAAITAPTATDNCAGTVTATTTDPLNYDQQGEYTVHWTYNDGNGNTTNQTQRVIIKDVTKPDISNCPSDITVYTGPGNNTCSQTATWDEPTATDNCSGPLTYFSRSDAPGSTFNVGTTRVTYVFKDDAGNESSCSFYVTVIDNTKPVVNNCPADITVYTGSGNSSCSQTATWTEPTATDNCSGSLSYVSRSYAPGSTFNVGTTQVTYVFKDDAGNQSSCSFNVTVVDNTKPVVLTRNISQQLNSSGTASITAAEVNNGSLDNCGIYSMSVYPNSFNCTNIGNNTVTLTVTDAHGNVNTATATVAITPLSTSSSVSVSPSTKQYSDKVTFTATLTPGMVTGGCQAATKVTFYVINQSNNVSQNMGTVDLNLAAGNLTGTLTAALLEPSGTSNGVMSLGTKTVKAVFSGVNSAFSVNDATTTLIITPEDAIPYYTGALFVSTSGSSSSSATVTLSATVRDITAETANAAYDGDPGDIRNATVSFIDVDHGNAVIATVPVGLVSSSDLKTGTATYNWSVNIGPANSQTYTIGIRVNNYYTRNSSSDNTVVTVSKPLGDFITGGGYLILQSPGGIKAGDAGSKNNFGFNVKYNSKQTNLQGYINTIIRKTESNVLKVYQIKGNSMTSLSANSTISPAHPYPTAIFNGKASIQDITNPLAPVSVDGNATLQVTMTDAGEPGSSDKIGITVWNKSGGLWYSSSWNGTKTIEQTLNGGNLVVRNGSTTTSGTVATVSAAELPTDRKVKVSPNPAINTLHVELFGYTGNVTMQLLNLQGKVMIQEKMQTGYSKHAQQQLKIGDVSSGVYFLAVIDDKGNRQTEKVIIAR